MYIRVFTLDFKELTVVKGASCRIRHEEKHDTKGVKICNVAVFCAYRSSDQEITLQ